MRQEESEPVCIVNGCGRTTLHRIGECAPDDAPTYSDGGEVQALVDDALTDGGLGHECPECGARFRPGPPQPEGRCDAVDEHGLGRCALDAHPQPPHAWEGVDGPPGPPQRWLTAPAPAVRTSAAVKQAQADERDAVDRASRVFGWQHLTRYSGQTEEWLDATLGAIVRAARGADL